MKPSMATHSRRCATALAAAALLIGSASPALAQETAGAGRAPMPAAVYQGKGDQCVRETGFMRRNHMSLILHQRDETMHEGIRTRQNSLKNCINCHADPRTNSVLGENGFCQSCHSYASVSMDCFSCHSSAPEKDVEPSLTRGPAVNPHVRDKVAFRPIGQMTDADRQELLRSSTALSSANAPTPGEVTQ